MSPMLSFLLVSILRRIVLLAFGFFFQGFLVEQVNNQNGYSEGKDEHKRDKSEKEEIEVERAGLITGIAAGLPPTVHLSGTPVQPGIGGDVKESAARHGFDDSAVACCLVPTVGQLRFTHAVVVQSQLHGGMGRFVAQGSALQHAEGSGLVFFHSFCPPEQ